MQWYYVKDGFVTAERAALPIQERGFRFGDGVFETIRLAGGKPYRWESHLRRLRHGLEAIHINYPLEDITTPALELISKNNVSEGLLRLSVSRGAGGQGYLPDPAAYPTLVMETLPLPETPSEPVSLWQSSFKRPLPEHFPTQAKTMQGLLNTLARMEAREHGCFEALMLNTTGELCEGSSSNLFWLKDGTLFTPSPASGALPGIMREAVIALSPWPVEEDLYQPEALEKAEAVFMTNSAWQALPVSSLEPKGWSWQSHKTTILLNQFITEDMAAHA